MLKAFFFSFDLENQICGYFHHIRNQRLKISQFKFTKKFFIIWNIKIFFYFKKNSCMAGMIPDSLFWTIFQVDDSSSIKKIVQRSDELFYDQEPTPLLNKLSPRSDNLKTSDSDQRKDFEDMEVAEDIVFRPLFRYRQETRVKPNYDESYRRSSYRTPRPYRYYETSYVPRKRYRPREYYNYWINYFY